MAWDDLGEVFARQNDQEHAVACFLLGYELSGGDSLKYLQWLKSDQDPLVRSASIVAISELSHSPPIGMDQKVNRKSPGTLSTTTPVAEQRSSEETDDDAFSFRASEFKEAFNSEASTLGIKVSVQRLVSVEPCDEPITDWLYDYQMDPSLHFYVKSHTKGGKAFHVGLSVSAAKNTNSTTSKLARAAGSLKVMMSMMEPDLPSVQLERDFMRWFEFPSQVRHGQVQYVSLLQPWGQHSSQLSLTETGHRKTSSRHHALSPKIVLDCQKGKLVLAKELMKKETSKCRFR